MPKVVAENKHFSKLNVMIEEMNYGRWSVPIEMVRSPEPVFRARVAQRENIDVIKKSFLRTHSVHSNSMVVGFLPSRAALPPKRNFDLHKFLAKNPQWSDRFFAVIGDHTQIGLHELHTDYAKNPLWAALPCQVLLTVRSQEGFAALKSWGILDNVKGQTRVMISFREKIFSLHEDSVHLDTSIAEGKLDAAAAKAVTLGLKSARSNEYAIPPNSLGQLWNIASRKGDVWTAIEKILQGNVVSTSAFLKPKSASPFVFMGGIPDEDLLVLLNKVVNGEENMKEFQASCKRYKAAARVQREILRHTEIAMDDWVAAQEKFPTACDPKFVDSWTQIILARKLKNKTPLPADFTRLLNAKVEVDLNVQSSRAQQAAVNSSFSFDCVCFININDFIQCIFSCLQILSFGVLTSVVVVSACMWLMPC